jgi:hypothetical protein
MTMPTIVGQPYYRPLDDRLHLFAQAGIFMFMLSGQVFINSDTIDKTTDVAMSVFLIGALIAFLMVFFWNFGRGLMVLALKFSGGLVRACPNCYCVRLHQQRQHSKSVNSSSSSLPHLNSSSDSGKSQSSLLAQDTNSSGIHDVELHPVRKTVVSSTPLVIPLQSSTDDNTNTVSQGQQVVTDASNDTSTQ